MLAQRDLDLHAGIGVAAEDFDDARDRLALRRRLLDDLDDDDVARFRAAALVLRDEQVLIDAPVLGHDEADAALLVQPSDDGAVCAHENVDDLAFRPAAPIGAGATSRRAVAVENLVHLARPQEQVRAAVVGDEKSEPVGVTLHGSRDEVELGDDAQLAFAVHQQLTVALHRGDAAEEGVARALVDDHCAGELGGRQRDPGVLQRVEDRVARRQQIGIDVAARTGSALGRRLRSERSGAARHARILPRDNEVLRRGSGRFGARARACGRLRRRRRFGLRRLGGGALL